MNDFVLPETRYAESGDVSIAYQAIGDGPVDIILVPGVFSHVEFMHELPGYTAFLRRLSSFARVVTFDKRGQGLSDRMAGAPSLEERMDDVRAIMDTIGSHRAVLLGFSEGCPMSALFAATYPERVSRLILIRRLRARGRPLVRGGLAGALASKLSSVGAPACTSTGLRRANWADLAVDRFAKFERLSISPGALKTILTSQPRRSMLPRSCPPCRSRPRPASPDRCAGFGRIGRKLADAHPRRPIHRIPRRAIMISGSAIPRRCTAISRSLSPGIVTALLRELERVLATVLFTDIVDSTRSAVIIGRPTLAPPAR